MKVFVEKLPTDCSYCDMCHTRPYDSRCKIDGEKFCGIMNEDVEVFYYHGDGRPDFCPLREIPNKKDIDNTKYMTDLLWKEGWNACLKEILSE